MKPKVYVETSVVSYLTGWPSRDLIVAAHQQITREWWQSRTRFDLYVSQIVIREAAGGDPEAAALRLKVLEGVQVLQLSSEVRSLAKQLMTEGPLPRKTELDALHIGSAVVNGMDYLLTWNCTHIANAAIRHMIEAVCRSMGYEPPVICTPEELMEG
ncbi:type II toxin-antitoxin system VapC family toxin [Dehalococcoidia bacterium]|nr:type II toxin-antitoxin system VapC family toxin [Dehalococcoidia bacterium]